MHKRIPMMLSGIIPALFVLSCITPSHNPPLQFSFEAQAVPLPAYSAIAPVSHGWRVTAAAYVLYVVQPGDSLSSIAQRNYGSYAHWPTIYWANKASIRYASLIYPGQRLVLPSRPAGDQVAGIPMAPATVAPAPVTTTSRTTPSTNSGGYGQPYYCGDGDGDGWDEPCATQRSAPNPAMAPTHISHAALATSGGYSVSSSFQACVIAHESGGNSQIWNASGHYGLYQFSASTWAAHGGNPADFGHASAAEQTMIFWNTVHADGVSDWAPYDGC